MLSNEEKKAIYENLKEDLIEYRLANNAGNEEARIIARDRAKAKLSIVNILGGMELAKEICNMFEDYDENRSKLREIEFDKEDGDLESYEPYNLTSAFDYCADKVIEGWYC